MRRLEGVRVAVTRPRAQAEALCAALEAEGAIPVPCPTIRIEPPDSWDELDHALARLDAYGWIVFTSANAAQAFLARLQSVRGSTRALARARVASVGSATAGVLEEHGVPVAYAPNEFTGLRLAETLEPVAGERVLFPRGTLGGTGVTELLRERGANVDEIVVYRTVPGPPSDEGLEELRRGVDAVTFTSPSTVQGFLEMGDEWRDVVREAVVASIGPVTSSALAEAGIDGWVEAREHTTEGLVDALAEAFEQRGATTKRGVHT